MLAVENFCKTVFLLTLSAFWLAIIGVCVITRTRHLSCDLGCPGELERSQVFKSSPSEAPEALFRY